MIKYAMSHRNRKASSTQTSKLLGGGSHLAVWNSAGQAGKVKHAEKQSDPYM